MTVLAAIASDSVLDVAFAWLCKAWLAPAGIREKNLFRDRRGRRFQPTMVGSTNWSALTMMSWATQSAMAPPSTITVSSVASTAINGA